MTPFFLELNILNLEVVYTKINYLIFMDCNFFSPWFGITLVYYYVISVQSKSNVL